MLGLGPLRLMNDSRPDFKDDNSVITIADKEISKMAHDRLEPLFSTGEHLLIDEEDPEKEKYFDSELLKKTKFVWSVDPIDGTRLYANRIPYFAVSIGLFKDLKPWLGVVYFPHLAELFFCDGEASYFVYNAFSFNEKKKLIEPIDQQITHQSVFLTSDLFFDKMKWKQKDCRVLISACGTLNMCWPAIGRGVRVFGPVRFMGFCRVVADCAFCWS